MVCSYPYSCFDLPVALVDCQVEGFALCLNHVCQGEYVAMYKINLDGADRKICCYCVDDTCMEGKTYKLKKMAHRTL